MLLLIQRASHNSFRLSTDSKDSHSTMTVKMMNNYCREMRPVIKNLNRRKIRLNLYVSFFEPQLMTCTSLMGNNSQIFSFKNSLETEMYFELHFLFVSDDTLDAGNNRINLSLILLRL